MSSRNFEIFLMPFFIIFTRLLLTETDVSKQDHFHPQLSEQILGPPITHNVPAVFNVWAAP
jgi:hypothetical protein